VAVAGGRSKRITNSRSNNRDLLIRIPVLVPEPFIPMLGTFIPAIGTLVSVPETFIPVVGTFIPVVGTLIPESRTFIPMP
jgi:hypothetical protein